MCVCVCVTGLCGGKGHASSLLLQGKVSQPHLSTVCAKSCRKVAKGMKHILALLHVRPRDPHDFNIRKDLRDHLVLSSQFIDEKTEARKMESFNKFTQPVKRS